MTQRIPKEGVFCQKIECVSQTGICPFGARGVWAMVDLLIKVRLSVAQGKGIDAIGIGFVPANLTTDGHLP